VGQDGFAAAWSEPDIAGTTEEALRLGNDLDADGDPDEVDIRLEVIEIEEEVYPGETVTFWVFAPEGQGMAPVAQAPSPTIRVEEGDRVRLLDGVDTPPPGLREAGGGALGDEAIAAARRTS